ncbi:ferrochelatase [Staphylococcus intermedius]|uniref:Coproporphyrin III ferrochelatase n=1 Tax=Staphylococcus intermedius NCTC 11048 TaxID=1141106 RepID=A0A380G598_STAIN|nr:ferrochelatase [Staphylococcus intermedius]PCF64529.1 ferrochelatase [Staphylococcus intermedius]PCF80137.1 ferrochelatase [Staphylococcus intermedius]PCF81488.1 ferrochelatase [Staphylococcus intermedius]PCF84646.1 ferrochelatase [Staphylococcus intermedius]PCF86011.1 ferrochelatase [Staphylococcus intermedius]
MKKQIGLLVMAYGTPYQKSDIEPYYTDIRHGRKPSEEELNDLISRYEAIGGLSPLAGTTERQAEAIAKTLNETYEDVEFKLYIGLKHIHPFIEDTVTKMHEDGITEAVTVVLAPHFSNFSVASYNRRAKEKADTYGIQLHHVEHYYQQQSFIDYWTMRVNETLENIPQEEHAKTVLVVSAHSLPEKMIKESNDPYPFELEDTARLIQEQSAIEHVAVGWQSEGNTGTPWLGPDVQDLTRDLFEQEGYQHFIYTPVGFVAEHLEVLYDNDYECKVVCDEVGATYHRPPMPDTHPLFIGAIVNEISKIFPKA